MSLRTSITKQCTLSLTIYLNVIISTKLVSVYFNLFNTILTEQIKLTVVLSKKLPKLTFLLFQTIFCN